MQVDIKMLDRVIEQTLKTVEQSKIQIFEIAEEARDEVLKVGQEIEKVKNEVLLLIEQSDRLEQELKVARLQLSKVSRNFHHYAEEDIRRAYEQASDIQVKLTISMEKEKQLRNQRDFLQLRLRNLEQTVVKAENLLTQMGAIVDYISGDFQEMGQILESAHYTQQMGLQIIQAQEEERKRVAREIHDGPAQSMANVVLRTELVEKILDQEGIEKARVELKELKSTVRTSLSDVRRIIFDLRPMALDDLGLIPTLVKYIESLNEKGQTTFDFQRFGKEVRLPPSMEVALFRLVQESLTNVLKHAQAKHGGVKLEFQKDRIFLIIKDDGVGFDLEQRLRKGYGVMGMKERVKLLNGHIVIHSSPNQGTKIMLTIPIPTD